MDKKANSKPMQELLKRLPENLFEVVPFSDDMILSQPIESWPVVDALIAFYSKGYPTMKAMEYIKLRKPYCINDLEMEHVLADRRLVYTRLQECGVNVPNYVVLNRDDPTLVNQVEEYDEYVIINGKQLNKPLVEKPVDAEDHNIYIYYPSSAGGGSKRLFRKVDNKSSMFHPTVNELRKEGSYIYEEFLSTSGVDVKVIDRSFLFI
jgi:inositol hexakisphosphate/diphosphoinositol-pentakisphosphate kinase